MKTLIRVLLATFVAQAQAQGLEADLDGNASALQASEMPQPHMKAAKTPNRLRVASR